MAHQFVEGLGEGRLDDRQLLQGMFQQLARGGAAHPDHGASGDAEFHARAAVAAGLGNDGGGETDGEFDLAEIFGGGLRRNPEIDQNGKVAVAVLFVLAYDGRAAAHRGSPVDPAEAVSFLPLADPVEIVEQHASGPAAAARSQQGLAVTRRPARAEAAELGIHGDDAVFAQVRLWRKTPKGNRVHSFTGQSR